MGNEQSSSLNRTPLDPPCSMSWKKFNCKIDGRESHCSAAIGSKVYLFGGSNDTKKFVLSVFDTETGTEEIIRCHGVQPYPLHNATLTAVNTDLYLFGGLDADLGWSNILWLFDSVTKRWQDLSGCGGHVPSPRDKHTTILHGNQLIVFGGFGPLDMVDDEEDDGGANFTWFNDVHSYDTESRKWSKLETSGQHVPSPRAAHVSTCYNDEMFVFGGRDSKARTQDIFKLNLTTKAWEAVMDLGCRPQSCSFHSAIQHKQFMLVFGGRLSSNKHTDSLHVFDCNHYTWYNPVKGDQIPSARGQCTLSMLPNDNMLVFGGSDRYNDILQCCNVMCSDVYTIDCGPLQPLPLPISDKENMDTNTTGESEVNGAEDKVNTSNMELPNSNAIQETSEEQFNAAAQS